MIFETERLLLRPFTWNDRDVVLAISSDPETTRYLYFWGRIGSTPESDATRFLDYATSTDWEYCLVKKDTGEKIGDGSVEREGENTAEIGWILLPTYRRQGYVTEMARRLTRYAFEEWGVEKVIARCDARNTPSQNVMTRLGMRLEEIEKESRPAKAPGEKNGDEYTYAVTKEEWQKRQAEKNVSEG